MTLTTSRREKWRPHGKRDFGIEILQPVYDAATFQPRNRASEYAEHWRIGHGNDCVSCTREPQQGDRH